MADKYVVTLEVRRKWTEKEKDEAAQFAYHKYRAKLIHGMVDALDIEVRDWQNVDDTRTRELIEIVVVLGPPLIAAAVEIWKFWLQRDMMKEVKLKLDEKTELSIGEASAENILNMIKRFPKAE
jgi:hypothetical protein